MPEWRLTWLKDQWCVAWDERDDTGRIVKRARFRLKTADKKQAALLAPAFYAEVTSPKGSTVDDLWKGYVKDREGRAVLVTMEHTWKKLKGRFGHLEGEAVTVEDCREYVRERRAAGRSDGTIHTELGHLRTVLNWAAKRRIIKYAPHIERPSKPAPKAGFLTRDEVDAMVSAATATHAKLAIILLITTGARVTAALELTWDRVDFPRRMLDLNNPFDRARRKSRAAVPINDTLMAALSKAHKEALTQYVIEWQGKPVKSIKKAIKKAGEAIGRPDVSPHMLRHSSAIWLAEAGHSMAEISQYLGHGDSRITERVYSRFSPKHLRTLSASLNLRSGPRFAEPKNENE